MQFKLILNIIKGQDLPINYQYPLSAAIYKIIAKGDAEYANIKKYKYENTLKFITLTDSYSF